jgi:predicted Zn-dependent protease
MRRVPRTVPDNRTVPDKMTGMKHPGVVRGLALSLLSWCAVGAVFSPVASAQGIPLIRDAEIEALMRDYARPIFKVAGLGSNNIQIRIIRSDSFNAFVADGRNVFMNSGALTTAMTPNEVIGVMAHETGHITGGHLAALRARIARDQTKALLVSVLGIGAMIAGASSKDSSGRDLGAAGQGVMVGGNELIMRSLLGERRSQEAAADQAGLKFLTATQQSGKGMLATFERFAQQEYISEKFMDPFVRSHPVATDRLAQLRDRVAASPFANAMDPTELQLRHEMMRAKLFGYLERPAGVLNRYPLKDTSMPARYARAIANNCSGKCVQAIGEVDALIREQPNNPYFWEIKGDFQYWAGQHKEAIPNLRKALQLAGGSVAVMQVGLAQALLGTEDPASLDEAIALLRKATVSEEDNSAGHHQLARALYRKGLQPQADLATAQGHFVDGNVKQAQIFAKRAQVKLKQGTPEWLRAEDIITFKEPT